MKKKIDSLGRIVIPYDLRKEIGLKNNDEANIELDNNKIIITKPGLIDYKSRCERAIKLLKHQIDILESKDMLHSYEDKILETLEGDK